MKLKEYLSKNHLTHADFSQKVDVSRVQITKIINGNVSPSAKLMKKIRRATRGEVSYEDLIDK
jgi:transcriptional regulator with XRE-family HTH domain